MKKRTVKMLLSGVLSSILILSGCGSGSGDKGNIETGDKSGVNSDEPVTITFQTWNPGEGDSIREVIAKFEEKNPDIKVNYVYMPYTDHVEKLKVDMASGQAADVYGMQTGATIKEFRDFEMELTPYAEKSWGENWEKEYLDFCTDLLSEDGKYYGLPLGLTYAGFVWADNTILEKYNLEVPNSLKELKKCAEILRENNEFPLTIGAKDAWINIDTWMSIANDINSEKLYSAIEGETSFTDEELVKSFEIWQSLFQNGVFQDGALGVGVYNDTSDMFEKEGSIPMILNGSWTAGSFMNTDPDVEKVFNGENSKHQAFLIDWNDDGKPAPVTASVDVCLCMNKNSKNPDAAWKFIDFMLHEGQDILINKYLSYCPSRTDLELQVEGISENGAEVLDYIVEQANTNLAGYREMAYAELKQVISDNLSALALGDVTPEEAAEAIEAASVIQER
ncbi:MAG: ABC transporter substrate-binding protein [Oliverpabstia sp.]|nr:ABC transporter substrate-binding protein [Oliverpabstia sp.]